MSSAQNTRAAVNFDILAELHLDFVDTVANAYASGQSFDEMCTHLITEDDYNIPDTQCVWDVLRDDPGVRADQMSRLASWINESPSNYQHFNHMVKNADPGEISGILSAKKLNGQVVLIHPGVMSHFIATRAGDLDDGHPERRIQHWLRTDTSYYKTFCEALTGFERCEQVDGDLGLPEGATYHILKLNPGLRRVFCETHIYKGVTKYLSKLTEFETAVRKGKSYQEIQSSTGLVQQSMSNNWTTLHPYFQSTHVRTFYAGINQRREEKRYEEGGDRYDLLQVSHTTRAQLICTES